MGSLGYKKNYNIFEINEKINKEDQKKYAEELDALEIYVSDKLGEEDHEDYYFKTGYIDILNYIKDKFITVMAYQDNERKIRGASYITQGQGLYTYNDLTKYFKFNDEYKEYAKSKYDPKDLFSIEYNTYMKKIEGYKYAKELIMEELKITNLVEYCKNEKENGTFDEKNEVREKVNRYIYNYFRDNENNRIGITELERFYLLKFSDLLNCEDNDIKLNVKKKLKKISSYMKNMMTY